MASTPDRLERPSGHGEIRITGLGLNWEGGHMSARAGVRGTDGEREGGRVGESGSVGEDLFAHLNE